MTLKKIFGPKIWNMLCSNIKAPTTTVSLTHSFKKEILEKLIFVDI